jgi:putative nucleotidyltransferase with HDIG domain
MFFCVVFVSTITTFSPEKYELDMGQKSPVDFKAPRDLEDRIATERLTKKAIEAVEPRERIDPTMQIDIKKRIEKFFSSLYEIRENQELLYEDKLNQLKEMNELNLNDKEMQLVLDVSSKELKSAESYIYEIVFQVMSTGIKAEELEKERGNITSYFMGLKEFSEDMRLLGINIVNSSIQPNRFLDVETTQQKRDEAAKSVEKVIIRRGNIIIDAGDVITEDKLQLLKDAGLVKEDGKKDISLYLGVGLFVVTVEILLVAYIYAFNRTLLQSTAKLYLILLIFSSIYLISKTMYGISSYMVPVATAAMLLSILIDARLAIVVNLVMSIFITVMTGNNIDFMISSLVGGTVGAFCMTHSHQRTNIFLSGLAVSLCNGLIILGMGFIDKIELSTLAMGSLIGVLNGILCAILTIGSLPLWETAFGILTPFKLLELSNPNHPVLKKLLFEAPGTYHHSIIVGNLSEAAADAVGANGLFARVSAYYHDIGKLKRPYFFKENQLTNENPHEKLSASLSTLIITSHVKDGVEVARSHKIPEEIIDIIEQHHGTTLVKYFYHKALSNDENEIEIEESSYRYDGIKPQTREAAIVMLADSVEAAVRSMSEHSNDKIKKLIHKIIEDKLKDHQLDDCDLTLKDIEKIAHSFSTVLLGIFHERIEYPDLNPKSVEATQ